MQASFIIGFHTKRMDNLLQTLRFLERNHPEVIALSQLVLVCQDKCDEIPNNFHKYQHYNLEVECMQLPVLTNFGIDKANFDKIIVLESDRILPTGYFKAVLSDLREGLQITTKNMLKLTRPATDEEIIKRTFDYKEESRSEENKIGIRNVWSGNTAIMKSDFYKAGKMDESYKGYGWADSDMTKQMESCGIRSVFREEIEIHLWHPSETYGSGDQKQMFIDNGQRFCKKWDQPFPEWFKEEMVENMKRKGTII